MRNRAGKFCRRSISIMLCRFLLRTVNVRHGTDISPPKEVRATIKIKNPSSSAGFKPAALGTIAGTLTTGVQTRILY
jgi:hypothetical protein